MYTTQNNRQRERQLDREQAEEDTDRQMYVTQNNRQREIVRLKGGGGGEGGYRQVDVYNIEQQIERQLDREEEEVATDRQMYTTQNNRQRERQLDREQEEEKEATDRCIQHRRRRRRKRRRLHIDRCM